MNKSLEERYLNVIEDNVNVGKSNVGIEFIILISGIAALIFGLYIFADTVGNFFIDRMSDETQMKIEHAFSYNIQPTVNNQEEEIRVLENIRDEIVPLDKKLQGKSKFPIYEINKKERHRLVNLLKNFEVTIKGFRPIDEAIITSGGINIKEINPKTMESKLVEGLYFAGEIIDVDAYTGGFNLQIAYSTGYVAGDKI